MYIVFIGRSIMHVPGKRLLQWLYMRALYLLAEYANYLYMT